MKKYSLNILRNNAEINILTISLTNKSFIDQFMKAGNVHNFFEHI